MKRLNKIIISCLIFLFLICNMNFQSFVSAAENNTTEDIEVYESDQNETETSDNDTKTNNLVDNEFISYKNVANDFVLVETTTAPSNISTYANQILSSGPLLNVGTGNESIYYPGYRCLSVLKRDGTVYDWILVEILYLNGQEVYCIEPDILTQDGASYYESTGLTEQQKIDVALISYFGYGYAGDWSMEQHAATQLAIWEYLGFDVWNYNATANQKKNAILSKVRNFYTAPSFGASTNIVLDGFGVENAVTLTDTNNVLSDYHVYTEAGFNIQQTGNTVKVWAEKGKAPLSGTIELDRFSRNDYAQPIVYRSASGSQSTVKIGKPKPMTTKINAKVDVGNLKIIKHNDFNKPIAGVKYKVSKNADMSAPVGTYTTNAKGEILAEDLKAGTYYYQEIYTPAPYVIDDIIYQTNIAYNKTTTEKPVNMHQKGSVTFRKESEVLKGYDQRSTEHGIMYEPIFEKGLLDGVRYQIIAEGDIKSGDGTTIYLKGDLVEEFVTDGINEYKNNHLFLGKYSLHEIATKKGYVKSNKSFDFELEYEGQNVSLSEYSEMIWNEKQRASLTFHKELEQSKFISKEEAYKDIKFGLYNSDPIYNNGDIVVPADSLMAVVDLNEDLDAIFGIDTAGNYYIKELSTNDHYVLDSDKYNFTFNYSGANTRLTELEIRSPIENKLRKGTIEIYKKDNEEAKAVPGVPFGLYIDEECTELQKVKVTDKNGYLKFDDLEPHTYYVKELGVAPGFLKNDEVIEVMIIDDNQTEIIEVENTIRRSDLIIEQREKFTKELLTYGEFELFADKNCNELIATAKADSNAIAVIEQLKDGEYYLKQSEPPTGYMPSEEVVKVTLNEDTYDTPYLVQLYYTKVPETGDDNTIWIMITTVFLSGGIVIFLYSRKQRRLGS